MDNEKKLIQRAQKGDHDAFASLVDEHQRYVYNLALRVVKDENEALDLTQETFAPLLPGADCVEGTPVALKPRSSTDRRLRQTVRACRYPRRPCRPAHRSARSCRGTLVAVAEQIGRAHV